MSNNANVFVGFGDGDRALNVKCAIKFDAPVKDFSFSLSSLLTIDSIAAGPAQIGWEITKEWQPQWQYKSNEIKISGEMPVSELIIEYHGRVSGWCNIIEERRIALSAYSAWFIFNTSAPVKALFRLKDMENYFVINARYDDSEKEWIYGETNHDESNIIALKKGAYQAANTGNFNFYYLNEVEKAYADAYTSNYDAIMRYYSSLFGKKDISKIDIVSLDIEEGGGAYFRKELIVIDKINVSDDTAEIKRNVIGLLGHELGHNWFSGANSSAWEDWLNETGAEWAALLYILSLSDNGFFEDHLSWAKESYKNTPVIKSPDGKRPNEGVHTRGVMLFYEIYLKYGADAIIKIMQTLANVKVHTTDNFLAELRAKTGGEISGIIERGLTMKDYAELFS